MRILICTGNTGGGSGLVAAATASSAAQSARTLLASVGPSHRVSTLLGTPIISQPQAVAPNLDAWCVDVSSNLSAIADRFRSRMPGVLAQVDGNELPLIPGIDFFLCLEGIRQAAAAGTYQAVVIDAGSHDALLRILSLPDSFRWAVRLLFGLDRGSGQSAASINRALLPTSLLPFEWVSQVQEARTDFENARAMALEKHHTTVRYVLSPDPAALQEARMAVPALHLHGLSVDALVVGPLLPAEVQDQRLAAVAAQQQAIATEAEQVWNTLPVLHLPLTVPHDAASFTELGQTLYAGRHPIAIYEGAAPINYSTGNDPFVEIRLPGIPRGALNLTLSGDELIVQTGPYRRHMLLPVALRGKSNIKASREGEKLIIRMRE